MSCLVDIMPRPDRRHQQRHLHVASLAVRAPDLEARECKERSCLSDLVVGNPLRRLPGRRGDRVTANLTFSCHAVAGVTFWAVGYLMIQANQRMRMCVRVFVCARANACAVNLLDHDFEVCVSTQTKASCCCSSCGVMSHAPYKFITV